MTPNRRRLLLLAAAALAAGCVPIQQSARGPGARGTEAWSWRMGATEKRWTSDRPQSEAGAALAAGPSRDAAEPEPVAAEDEAEMTLEPDPVGPAAKKPTAVAVSRPAKKARGQELRASDSDEEFLDKILNDKADAPSGEITMAAMEMPASKVEQPAKKKRMTRAEKRKARLLAKLEKRKAKEIAAREARLRGKRARADEEENQRASSARKTSRDSKGKKARKSKKGEFDENGEGFIDEDDEGDAEQDDVEREIAAGYDDEEDDEDEEPAAPPPKKAKPAAASSKAVAKAPVKKVKTDWSGQAIDDEDPLKGKKK
jgi:hypothetical protein